VTEVKGRLYYGWVIVTAFFFIGTIMYGALTSFGVFFKFIAAEFSLSRTETSLIFSLQNLIASVFSFIGGWAVDKYGPRIVMLVIGLCTGLSLILTSQTSALWQLFITYSLLFSVIGAVYTIIISTVSRWFEKNRGIALGIAGSGIGMGMAVIAPFATYLITSLGWRGAYIVLGVLAWFLIIPLSRLLKEPPVSSGNVSNNDKDIGDFKISPNSINSNKKSLEFSLRDAFGTRSFWLFGSIWFLNAFGYFLVLIHFVPHATDSGIHAMEAATILSVIGASFIAGRIILGKVSDSVSRKKTAAVSALFIGLSVILLLNTHDLLLLYVFGFILGFCNGGLDTAIAAMVSETFGTRNIGVITGILQVNWGIGIVIGPLIGGFIFDIEGSYFIAFLSVIIVMFVIALLVTLTRRESKPEFPI
jgi:MFS family permease